MADHLRHKLEQYVRLSGDDRNAVSALGRENLRSVPARRDIIREGEQPRFVKLFVEGWGFRHKLLEDGRRQIIAFLIPGDLCDLNNFILKEMDHSISALTPVTIAQIPHENIEAIDTKSPRVAQALRWDMMVQAAIQREWAVNLGQRSAIERVAHLLCELFARLEMAGLCNENRCEIPITQIDLSEATGITAVHVNRTLQELRAQKLIQWKGREVTILDMDGLKRLAMFNDNYLHRNREGAHLDANG